MGLPVRVVLLGLAVPASLLAQSPDPNWDVTKPRGTPKEIDFTTSEGTWMSTDITPDETPFEAGLGFAVALDKEADFIGRDALVAAKAAGPRKRLRCLVLDDPRSVCLGNEPVRIGGEIVGRVTSGGYGYVVERSIAYAYLPPDAPIGTRGEIDVFGEWIGFEAVREPLWDPANERIRA